MESKGRFIALFIANLLFVLAAIGSVIFASVYWDSAKKKDYDMSGVVFDDLTVEYDGLPHSILATNLPKGVTASYENNDQTDMGEYIVTAHFKGDEKRYNPIPDMTAALNIIQPARSRIMSAIGFEIDETSEPPRIFCNVSNATEYIDLTDKITVTPNCIWKLFKDFDGEEVASKAMSLETGHNTAYIIIYDPSDNTSVYEVDVYRLAMKSYIFKNEGQVHASGTIEERSQLLGPEIPEKPYYTFTGWAVEGSRDIVRFPYTVTEDITFVAQYTPTNYKITYYLDGGTNDARNPAFYNIEMSDIELLPATRAGYIFDGWYSDRQFDTQVTVIQAGSFGAKELYAKWVYGSEGLIFEQVGNEYKVIGYNGNDSEIIVPDTWKSLPVTAIGKGVFENCTNLEKITLPFVGQRADGLTYNDHFGYIFGADTYVGNSTSVPSSLKTVIITGGTSIAGLAFNRCESLKSVTLPDTVTSIGNAAFNHCTSLESIEIPNSITEISSSVFVSCISLTDVVIPDSVTSIGEDAFGDCTSLTGIIIPDSVKIINRYAFRHCTSLEEITLPFVGATKDGKENTHFGYIFGASSYSENSSYVPSSLKTVIITGGTTIDYRAFFACNSLEEITLPFVGATKDGDTNTHFGYIFGAVQRTESADFVPSSLKTVIITGGTYIADYAFYECAGIARIELPAGLTSIGGYAFYGCTGLESITLPDGVTSIGSSAFWKCTSLKSINIPASLNSIDSGAFYNCTSLTAVYITDIASWCLIKFKNSEANPLYYAQNLYLNNRLLTALEIPASVTYIGSYAFYNCVNLKSVKFGGSGGLTRIGAYAFYYCQNLTGINIPVGVTSIDSGALLNCTSLASITLPDGMTSIGGSAFTNTAYYRDKNHWTDKALYINNYLIEARQDISGSYTVISGTKLIADSAFYYRKNLEGIIFPNGISVVPYGMLEGCESLTYVQFPVSLTAIGESAFSFCTSLESITIPAGVTSIGRSAFSYCEGLKSVVFSENSRLTTIGIQAFRGCTSLESIDIPDGVTTIGDSTFRYCVGLNYIYIPSSVTEIGNMAFGNCTNLERVTFGENSKLTILRGGAFIDCTSLKSIEIPSSVTTISSSVFARCEKLERVSFGQDSRLTTLASNVFRDCISLESIEIPAGVTQIRNNVFSGCKNLKSVIFKNTRGWTADDISISSSDLEKPAIAAEYLKNTYISYNWSRAESE